MKVKVIKRYNDMVLHKIPEVGTTFEVADARGKYLIGQGMVEEVKAKKTEGKAGDPVISQ